MSTSANRKMVALPRGVKIEPLYSECPKCGCDLTELPDDNKGLIKTQGRNQLGLFMSCSVAFRRLADKCLRTWK